MDGRLGNTKAWFFAAMVRVIRTMAQVALSMISVGAAIQDINWINVLSVTLVSGIYSFLTAIATGLPESKFDGRLIVTDVDDTKMKYTFEVNGDPQDLSKKDTVTMKVEK